MIYPVNPIVFAMQEIVAKVSTEVLETLQEKDSRITGVHYDYGHWLEIAEDKSQKSNSPKQATKLSRYPCVMLFEDIPVNRNRNGYWGIATLTMLIATGTKPTYKSGQREQESFIPILNPIYEALMKQIGNSEYFVATEFEPHTLTDRKYLGRVQLYGNDGNTFNDFLDAKEITNLQLTVNYDTCMAAINILET